VSVVELDVRDGVAWIYLNRPEKLNAIDDDVLDGLLEAVADVEANDAVGASVLSGRGRAFSAGGDITAMAAMDKSLFAATIGRYMEVAAAIHHAAKPMIAAVHGYVLAGGFELALLCDLRFAAEGTVFGLPDTPLGLSPTSGMTHLLPRVVGLGRALELALTAENLDAAEALEIGLVTRLAAPDALLDEAGRCAARIAAMPRSSVARTRRLLRESLDRSFAETTTAELTSEVDCFLDPVAAANLSAFATRKR
jgi:enoyl-CoA hydratase/carnithine racemase